MYDTLKAGVEVSAEIVEKKSRFIAQLKHVESVAEADAFIGEVRARHKDARHNVPAYVLANGVERGVDDGEPARTAGIPTLDVLKGAGLEDVCCVTTRYFGGTLLGAGGLVRAYTQAAQAAVARARNEGTVVAMREVVQVAASLPYAWYDRVMHLAKERGARVTDQLFCEDVTLTLVFPAGEEERFIQATTELNAGEPIARVQKRFFGPL
jgi:uncharacterized YigZ family protein